MNRIGLLRVLAGCGARSSMSQQLQRNPIIGRQGKKADGRIWLVGLSFAGLPAFAPAGASAGNLNDFNAPTAVAISSSRSPCHEPAGG